MKKTIITLVLLLALVFCVFGQASGPIDLVVLLDTSASMSSYYRETSDYLIGPFLREFLRIGDTFHLISFAGSPRLEVSRRIESVGDMEVIIARLLLMYPLYPQSNLGEALGFAENFSANLPAGRQRKVVLISDGSAANAPTLVNNAQASLRNRGVDFQHIQIPVTGSGPVSGRSPVVGAPIQAPPPAVSVQQPPQQVPAQPPPGQPPAVAAPPPGQPPPGQPPAVAAPPPGQPPPGQPPAVAAPPPGQPPPGQPPAVAAPPPGQPPPGQPPAVAPPAQQQVGLGGLPLPLLIGLGILALALLALIVFLASRRLHSSPNRVMARASSPVNPRDAELMSNYSQTQKSQARPPLAQRPPERKPLPKDKVYEDSAYIGGPVMLNLFVEDQNRAIGRRNIHTAKSGTFSVGGGKSDFLIFLVPLPQSIANVQFDGRNCTFIPLKPKYFPDIGSQSIHNCIGKNIRVISDKGYELFIRVERYEDPLKVLNRLLNSIAVPGPVPVPAK